MNAFVTGGTGFIGSHLTDALIDHPEYETVKCLVRSSEKWLEGKSYQRIDGGLHSLTALMDAIEPDDVIFHIAGVVKAPSQKEFDYANVEATENLLRIAEKKGVKKMVILSSLAAAGPSSGSPLTEQNLMNPVSRYGESKKRMEQMIHRLAPEDMSITILRPPAVYGPREDQIFMLFKMMKFGVAPIVGDGNHPELSIMYVQDVVQALLKAATQSETGVHTYFISGPEIANWNKIRDIVSTVLGRKNISVKLNPDLVKKIAGAVETTASLFGTYPVINREKANEMILEWTCSYEKAARELNYEPQYSLSEGLSRTLTWYRKHGWL
ncbi:MAG: NAD-dependent epimerase/dehydratase family protein [Balneolaceae bacterium]|nr:NAD-dependent epimerase/dehydratase family protein [Balneolaceae bacterium]